MVRWAIGWPTMLQIWLVQRKDFCVGWLRQTLLNGLIWHLYFKWATLFFCCWDAFSYSTTPCLTFLVPRIQVMLELLCRSWRLPWMLPTYISEPEQNCQVFVAFRARWGQTRCTSCLERSFRSELTEQFLICFLPPGCRVIRFCQFWIYRVEQRMIGTWREFDLTLMHMYREDICGRKRHEERSCHDWRSSSQRPGGCTLSLSGFCGQTSALELQLECLEPQLGLGWGSHRLTKGQDYRSPGCSPPTWEWVILWKRFIIARGPKFP